MVRRRLLSIYIALAIVVSNITIALDVYSVGSQNIENKIEVHFLTENDNLENFELIENMNVNKSIEMWHYSGNYWKITMRGRTIKLRDNEMEDNWDKPDYLGQKLMEEDTDILFEINLPQKVRDELERLSNGEKIHVYINKSTLNIDRIFQNEKPPTFEIEGDKIIIHAYPKLNCLRRKYDYYVSGLEKKIPIVIDKYGHNVYAMYGRYNNKKLGMAYGTHTAEEGKIPYNKIINNRGYLEDGFIVNTFKDGVKTPKESSQIKIGIDTFKYAGAVGLMFRYPMEIKFYKKPLGKKVNVKHITKSGRALAKYDYSKEVSKNKPLNIKQTLISGFEITGSMIAYDQVPTNKTLPRDYQITYNERYNEVNIVYIYQKHQDEDMSKDNMDPEALAVIKADDRGMELFNVEKGIPTTEDLYVNVLCNKYLMKYTFKQKSDVKDCEVTARKEYTLRWSEEEGTGKDKKIVQKEDVEVVTETVTVPREYSYWYIDNLEVYELIGSSINNKALPSGKVYLQPNGYRSPIVEVEHSDDLDDHIEEPELNIELEPETITGGLGNKPSPSGDFQSEADEKLEELKVKNDKLVFNGQVIMSDKLVVKEAPKPISIEDSDQISKDTLYNKNLTIDAVKRNRVYESTGNIKYRAITRVNPTYGQEYTHEISDINSVTVHTPVVCYADVYDDRNFNQELNPIDSRRSLILGRPSSFTLPTSGEHRNIKGYKNRDYKKYTKSKQVRFPFDVYMNTTKRNAESYLKSNTWFDIPLDNNNVDIYLPIWVEEGNYEIEFREIAINCKNNNLTEVNANLELENYVATRKIPVRVIGRLYGFKITDITDYPTWEKVFRVNTGDTKHTGNHYISGHNDKNGVLIRANSKGIVPILRGSHPYYKNVGPLNTGYKFRYELETVGGYFGKYDCIRVRPHFYHVTEDGKTKTKIDLWYMKWDDEKNKETIIKIGSEKSEDKKYIERMKLGNPYRNVPKKEIEYSAGVERVDVNTMSYRETPIGYFHEYILAKFTRIFLGNTENIPYRVDYNRVKQSVQHWHGDFCLPNMVYACPKGFDLMEYGRTNNGFDFKEYFWLKEGYIVVNFTIETIKNKDFNNPVLCYTYAPNCNMWKVEGYDLEKYGYSYKTDSNSIKFNLFYGDVMFYNASGRASDDYSSNGTH
ncbi:DUF5704 domain-containing protein [Clostridiaceae bacterium M8S5]|nr:DUF5704 domain-containing protein [Clostridiaceae bacterium M8S5]